MRSGTSLWSFALVVLLTAQRVAAEPLRLTIEDAVARARAVNLDASGLELARADLERSKALLPSNPFVGAGAQHTSQAGIRPNYGFFVSQEFEVAGQRAKRIGVATRGLEKETWELRGAELNLAATVKAAFVHALLSIARVPLAREATGVARDLAGELARQSQTSDIQRIELNNARIQEHRTQRDLANAELSRDTALGALRRLLGLAPDQAIELAGAVQSEIKEPPPAADLVERALRQRPDLLASRAAAQRADLQVSLTRRDAIPNITISGTLSRFEDDTLAGGDVGFPLPLFQRKTADVVEAVTERNRAAFDVQNLEREIAHEVVEARRACAVAAGDLEAQQREIVPRSEENLRLERRLYQRGAVTASDLIGLQIDLLTARRDHLQALEAHNDALIELERVTADGAQAN
jgi:cobalt-zinc-cadmium efflux system outer membrane protein